jgi:hypothetical protein
MSSPTPLTNNSSDIIITFTTCNRCGSTNDYCYCANDNVDSPRPRKSLLRRRSPCPHSRRSRHRSPSYVPHARTWSRLARQHPFYSHRAGQHTTNIREVHVDEGGERVEEGSSIDSPPSYGQPATIFPDCTCGAEGGEYCHCAERCTRGADETV